MSLFLSLLLSAAPSVQQPRAETAASVKEVEIPAGKVSTANPRSIVAALQEEGYRAKLMTDEKRPYIESATNGARFFVYLQSCDDAGANCRDVLFQSSYNKKEKDPLGADAMNAFNRKTRWVRTYLDEDNDPVVEMDLLFTEQMIDRKMFSEAVTVWAEAVAEFHKAIDY